MTCAFLVALTTEHNETLHAQKHGSNVWTVKRTTVRVLK